MARLRAAGSSNTWRSNDSEVGTSNAAPNPWATRQPIRAAREVARPQPTEARLNRANPAMNTRLAPNRSPNAPASSSEEAKTKP